jgi:hypothetical protein
MFESPTTTSPAVAADDQPSRRRRRGILALLLGLTTISLGAGMFSLAVFTDSDASTGTFTTGTVLISSTPETLVFNVADMIPGDVETAALTVANAGTADLRYAMIAGATGVLGAELTLEVKTQDVGGPVCTAFDGTTVGSLTGLNGAAFGNPAQGPHSGDRNLVASDDEILCLRVALPLAATSAVQNATSTATFTFYAEQTQNNP